MKAGSIRRFIVSATLATIPALGMFACNQALKIDELELGECLTDESRCASVTQPQTCDANRKWKDLDPCVNQTCKSAACVGECVAGKKRCGGSTPEVCDAQGQWQKKTPCGVGETCKGGACVILCIPGDLQCSGDQPQRCDDSGNWQNEAPKCKPCIGCDPSTGVCATSPKQEGDTCEDDNACTLVSTCKSGNCVAAPEFTVMCLAENTCSAGPCNPMTGSCDVTNGTTCDDGDTCSQTSVCAAGVCGANIDRSFAHWDLRSPPPTPRFTVLAYGAGFDGSELVYDNLTHLLWERSMRLGAEVRTFDAAKALCESLSYPGYPSGFRLPSRIEIASLVDDTKTMLPFWDVDAFPLANDNPSDNEAEFWSSSPSAKDASYAWAVNFKNAFVVAIPKDSQRNVRCVR